MSILDEDPGAASVLAVLGLEVTAVIDFSSMALIGDRRLNPLSAAVYLVDADDRKVAEQWLREHGLFELLEPARRWLAAYWSCAVDDTALARWCRAVLLDGAVNA